MDDKVRGLDRELFLRLLHDGSREHAFIFLDTEGHVIGWSPGAQQVFGYREEEVLGKPLAIVFTPEDVAMGIPEHEMEVALLDGAAEDDRWSVRADGVRFWASGALLALRREGRLVGFGKIVRNRTELREQLETLRNQVAQAQAAERRHEAFLSTLSHELRNPLAPLANAVQIIRSTRPAGAEVEYGLRVIERQMDLLQRLVNDLLDVSRVNAGKVQLQLARLDLCGVLRNAIESTCPLAAQRRHEVRLVVPAGDITVEGDAHRLEQVFVNLITNAAKYTPPGGQIWVKATVEEPDAVVRVEDTGVGLPAEMVPRIFELFTQVEASRADSLGGLGVGLALVKNLVELHGGSVQAKSDGPGKGSEFTVRLPLAGQD